MYCNHLSPPARLLREAAPHILQTATPGTLTVVLSMLFMLRRRTRRHNAMRFTS